MLCEGYAAPYCAIFMLLAAALGSAVGDSTCCLGSRVLLARGLYENVRAAGVLSERLLPDGWHWVPDQIIRLTVLGTALCWAGARVAPSFAQVIQSLHDVAAQIDEAGQPVAAGPS
ncbi:hypothetical protein ABPG77_001943 [Micractinium sp. CCAP 211/92]